MSATVSEAPIRGTAGRTRPEEVPALIVGAGPAGLSAAIALARAGIESLLVERRSELSSLPRATTVSIRTMELMRAWGLEDEVRAGGPEVEWQMWVCETLASAADGYAVQVGIPSREAAKLISPSSAACVPQDHLESVLFEHLRSMPSARVELGTELLDLAPAGEGFDVTLRSSGGEVRTVSAGHLIGADGAHGGVRGRLGIARWDSGEMEHAHSALFRAPLWEILGERRYGLYSLKHPAAPGIFLPAGIPDRWLYGVPMSGGGQAPDGPDEAAMMEQIRIGAGIPDLDVRIERVGGFRFVAGLAEEFRRGNAFLIGDAAHRVTPRGGTGMNMAIQGAYSLGWRLAWVLRGWADARLLDSYETERLPLVRHNIERSTDPDGSSRDPGSEVHADLAGRIPHVWTRSEAGYASVLDLTSDGLTLLAAGDAGDGWDRAASSLAAGPPVRVRRVDAIAARALGISDGAAILLRPDAVQVAWFPGGDDPAGALQAAICATFGSGRPQRRLPAVPGGYRHL